MTTNSPWSQLQEDTHAPLRGFLRSIKKHLTSQAILVYGSAARREFLQGYSNINVLIVLEQITQPVLHSGAAFKNNGPGKKSLPRCFSRTRISNNPQTCFRWNFWISRNGTSCLKDVIRSLNSTSIPRTCFSNAGRKCTGISCGFANVTSKDGPRLKPFKPCCPSH